MTWFDYLTMFFSSFFMVFLLGLQSKNVNNSKYVAAVVTSFGISLAQFLFTKYAAAGNAASFFTMAAGGCAGIFCSILIYDMFFKKTPPPKPTQSILAGRLAHYGIDTPSKL